MKAFWIILLASFVSCSSVVAESHWNQFREADQHYRLKQVNGHWEPGKPKLVAPRTFVVSPFPEDAGKVIYFGGFDCNFFPARDTAWVFRAPLETVLGAGL